jgi:hypothetical protein
MAEARATSSRRSLLARGLLLAAGAVGVSAARRSGTAQAATEAKGSELRLYGRNFHLHAPSHAAGQVPVNGDRPGGEVVGHFSAAHLTQESPFAAAASSLEIHTFTLKTGTIHGLGSATRGAEGHFVILGGTGIYTGAQGSYVSRQHPRELGGNGTAEFRLTLAGREAANGV